MSEKLTTLRERAKKIISILLCMAITVTLIPSLGMETASAVNATSATITESDGTQTVITVTTGTAEDPWSYNAETATLTLNNWTGQKISANGDLNLHLVGTNTITIPSSTAEVVGIYIGSSSSMFSLNITADTGGTLNINGTTQGDFYGVKAYTYITNGTVNIDITSSGSSSSYGMWGNVYFTENETSQATLNVKVKDTDTTKYGYLSAFGNGGIFVENRSNVTVNAEAHVSSANKYTSCAIDDLYIYKASPVITATADCPDGASTKCLAVETLRALELTEGGKVTANGMVRSYYLPEYLDAHVVTTTPANNNYLFRRGTDLGIKNDTYYYMCGTDGSILNKAVFEYSKEAAAFKWVGGSYYDIPGGMVGDSVSPTNFLLAGLRGADGLYDSSSNTKFEILSGSLPSGLRMHQKGGINGTVTAPCEAGSVTVKATDTNDSTRTTTFTINYGKFVEPDKYLTIGVYDAAPTVVEMKTNGSGTGWSYDGTTKTLTLNGYNGGPIAAELALNLHLVGTNTITIPSSTAEVVGIYIGSSSSMFSLNITADTGGTLNINGTTQGDFYGVKAYTYITNGTVNIDITSSGSSSSYGMWGNVNFTENETSQATLNVKVTDTDTTKKGYLSAFGNGGIFVENRSNVTVNAEAHVSSANKYTSCAIDDLYIYKASPVITATADCPDGASTKCLAVETLRALELTEGGKVTANGMVRSYYLPDYLDAHVVTTTPADNNYLFRRGTDLGIKNDTYYYMCGTDGSILNKAVFEYSKEAAAFKWVGGSYYDIPGGMVGDSVSPTNFLLAGLRGADGLYDSSSNTKFEILSGSLPSGLRMHQKGGINGTVTAPCEAGSVTIKATDTNDSTRTVTFTINYGKFVSQNPVTDMTLNKTEMILEQGATETITATVTPADASYPNVKAVSSDAGIAYVSVGAPSGASSTVQTSANYKVGKATVTVTSIDSSLSRTFDVYVKEKTPTATLDYINEKLTGLESGATYRVSVSGMADETFMVESSSYAIKESWLGKTVTLVRTNAESKCDSSEQEISIPARGTAPTTPAGVSESYDGAGDGKLTGVTSAMQYRKTGESSWNYISGDSVSGLSAGSYEVRYKATSSAFASAAKTVNIGTEPLSFADNTSFDIPEGAAGTAISSFSVAGAADGGKKPYTFSKLSGPGWLNVATDGTVSGTRPASGAAASTAVIKVTDGAGNTKTIEIAVGKVTAAASDSKRIYGANRYETAMKVADQLKAELGVSKFSNIIVADGRNYADALSGVYLAKVKNAPVLVVGADSASQTSVKNYIKANLETGGTVYILGGTGAVSQAFQNSLTGCKVTRLGGADRYETNMLILKAAGVTGEDMLVCSGLDYADALSASAVGKPILLTGKNLTDAQLKYLKNEISTKKYYIIGGEGAVGKSVETQLKSLGTTDRIWGSSRFETSTAVANKFFAGAKTAVLAYGFDFPDGLSGGPLALANDAPLILVTSNNTKAACDYAAANKVTKLYVLGGPALISNDAVNEILNAGK